MSILTEHLPAAVVILTNSRDEDFATAVYSQFTSGTAPPWFKAMPTDAQSFVLLDYLPNGLSTPMTLDMLALATVASPAARPTGTTSPTSTSTHMPSATKQALGKTSEKNGTLVAAILIPLMLLALALGFSICYVRHRRHKRARSLANDLPPVDAERAARRWSESTFGTAVQPPDSRIQSSMLPLLPSMAMTNPPGRMSHPMRRALSESDLSQIAGPRSKATDLECVSTQSNRAELEAQTAPLVKC